MTRPLIEFPADDAERALRFWQGLLGVSLEPRPAAAGQGWVSADDDLRLGVHERGKGPGDTGSLPYFPVAEMAAALERVQGSEVRSSTRASAGRSAVTPRAARSRWS